MRYLIISLITCAVNVASLEVFAGNGTSSMTAGSVVPSSEFVEREFNNLVSEFQSLSLEDLQKYPLMEGVDRIFQEIQQLNTNTHQKHAQRNNNKTLSQYKWLRRAQKAVELIINTEKVKPIQAKYCVKVYLLCMVRALQAFYDLYDIAYKELMAEMEGKVYVPEEGEKLKEEKSPESSEEEDIEEVNDNLQKRDILIQQIYTNYNKKIKEKAPEEAQQNLSEIRYIINKYHKQEVNFTLRFKHYHWWLGQIKDYKTVQALGPEKDYFDQLHSLRTKTLNLKDRITQRNALKDEWTREMSVVQEWKSKEISRALSEIHYKPLQELIDKTQLTQGKFLLYKPLYAAMGKALTSVDQVWAYTIKTVFNIELSL